MSTLIKVTEQRRSKWIQNTNDILPGIKPLLDEWKADYPAWINQSSQDEWYRTWPSKRREFERKRFRNFLFKMCGCYELVIFWLRVQASWTSLCIFQTVFDEERIGVWRETTRDKMNRAEEQVRAAQSAR